MANVHLADPLDREQLRDRVGDGAEHAERLDEDEGDQSDRQQNEQAGDRRAAPACRASFPSRVLLASGPRSRRRSCACAPWGRGGARSGRCGPTADARAARVRPYCAIACVFAGLRECTSDPNAAASADPKPTGPKRSTAARRGGPQERWAKPARTIGTTRSICSVVGSGAGRHDDGHRRARSRREGPAPREVGPLRRLVGHVGRQPVGAVQPPDGRGGHRRLAGRRALLHAGDHRGPRPDGEARDLRRRGARVAPLPLREHPPRHVLAAGLRGLLSARDRQQARRPLARSGDVRRALARRRPALDAGPEPPRCSSSGASS